MHPDVIKRKLGNVCGVRVMAQLLRAPAALAEGLGLIHNTTSMMAHHPVTSVLGIWICLPASVGTAHKWCTNKTPIHTK